MDYRIDNVETLLCLTWHKDSGSKMNQRPTHGFVICDGSEFSFYKDGKEIIADSTHLLVLPKGSSYNFKCRRTGIAYTYNFNGAVPGDSLYTVELRNNVGILSFAKELRKVSDAYTKIGLMYRIVGEALGSENAETIPDIIRPQTEYIRKNFGLSGISNEFLASMTNISEVYFRKLFTKTFGVSPHEYITELRLDTAKQMLLGGRNVSETATLCGFSGVYYFSSAFKRKVGKSPSEFVRQNGII